MTRTHAGTFWMPTRDMRAAGPFRNGVERAIASLARARAVRDAGVRVFADDARASETIRGAEWWIQDVARDEPPKTFHTDCDAVVMSSGDDTNATEIRHPAVASVLYVGQAGGPTAVFGQRKKNARLVPRYPSEVAVAHPTRNTLLLFEGDRYHAVMHPTEGKGTGVSERDAAPSELTGTSTTSARDSNDQRVTVLVNWWRDRPRGATDLPDRFVTPPFDFESESGEINEGGRTTTEPTLTRVPVVDVPHAFVKHADAWRAQTVPRALLSPRRALFVARYETPKKTPAPPSAIEPGTDESVVQEWPFENDDEDDVS